MSDIFISYSSEDRPRAQVLAEALVQHGWSVWWDRTIPSGKRFDQVIQEALAAARCVLVLWSRQSIASDWVLEEAEEGRKRQILIPVQIEEVLPPMGFRRIQAADLIGWDGAETSQSFRKLVADIEGILGPPVKTETGQVAPVETKEAGPAVVEPEKEPVLAPEPPPPEVTPPVEPPRPPRPPPWPKLLPWFIGVAVLAGVFVAFWVFQKPEPIRRVEPPLTPPTAPITAPTPPKIPAGERPKPTPPTDMVVIPAGEFWLGCNEKVDSKCLGNERPGGNVYLHAFFIDTHEVTVADYRKCMEAGKCSSDGLTYDKVCNWDKPGREQHPINCIVWNQARTYCAWIGKRLPTEDEWEKAARGTDGRIYPWGNQWDSSRANVSRSRKDGTVSVGSYPSGISPYGVYDMVGNVWEWTSTLIKPYPYKADDREDPKARGERVLRGGSWGSNAMWAKASSRSRHVQYSRVFSYGFRCAKTP